MRTMNSLTYRLMALGGILVILSGLVIPAKAQDGSGLRRRSVVTLTADAVTPAATDTAVSVTTLKADVATAAQSQYPVTAARTLRINSLHLQFTSSTTTANKVRVRLRTNVGGACTVASPYIGTWELALPVGTLAANQGQAVIDVTFPQGIDLYGLTRTVCVSAIAAAANGTLSLTVEGFEY